MCHYLIKGHVNETNLAAVVNNAEGKSKAANDTSHTKESGDTVVASVVSPDTFSIPLPKLVLDVQPHSKQSVQSASCNSMEIEIGHGKKQNSNPSTPFMSDVTADPFEIALS